jgi:hypothetical protein
MLCAMLAGCSSNAAKPSIGAITFTNADGIAQPAVKSLTVNTATYLDVVVSADNEDLGADWTVYCGSQLPPGTPLPSGTTVDASCGTFTPVHTQSGPVPTYASSGSGYVTLYTAPASPPKNGVVTLYAASTSDPSVYSSVTLAVEGLPITIGFAPAPPATLPVNGTVPLNAVLTNDYVSGGANWTVTCGSSACGSFSAAHTASGTATTYTAPASVPSGGTVTVIATSVTDPTKTVSANITIQPVTVSVAPSTLSVAPKGTAVLNATVSNDFSNAGVDWSLTCGTAGACGSITAHTASGAAATFAAPSAVPSGNTVTITATSTSSNKSAGAAIATITAAQAGVVNGAVRAGFRGVEGSSVFLYATGNSGYKSASTRLSSETQILTDESGNFSVSRDEACPNDASELYLVARGGDAGGGFNKDLTFMLPLGLCSALNSRSGVVLNEVTTVASAYALAGFMADSEHVGTVSTNQSGLANAFARVGDLINPETGLARVLTQDGTGVVPQTELNTLANALHGCAVAVGSSCGNTLATLQSAETRTAGIDTVRLALSIATHASMLVPGTPGSAAIERLATDEVFAPALAGPPADWTLAIRFATRPKAAAVVGDASGNLWSFDPKTGITTEYLGLVPPAVGASNAVSSGK